MPDSIYVNFLLQPLALLATIWFVLAFAGRSGRQSALLVAAGVVLAVVTGSWALGVRPASKALGAAEARFATISDKAGARTDCVNEPPLTDLGFVKTMQSSIPSGARYALFGNPTEVFQVKLCIAQIELPRTQVQNPAKAQYLAFYGVIPPQYTVQARKGNPAYTFYAKGFGILKVAP